jgi:3-hydroxyacyl-CoA dehydrogenase
MSAPPHLIPLVEVVGGEATVLIDLVAAKRAARHLPS